MMSAPTASRRSSACTLAAVRSKRWRSRLRPPTRLAAPITSSTLPRMEPTSDALTTSCSPSLRAKNAMISSGALPNVTLRKPPMPGPERAASSSVALPISAAVGMTPSAEAPKMTDAEAPAISSTIASGMNGTSRYGHPSPEKKKPRSRLTRQELTEDACPGRGRPGHAVGLGRRERGALLRLRDILPGRREAVGVLLEVLLRGAAGGRRRPGARGRAGTRRARAGAAERAAQAAEAPELRQQLVERLRVRRLGEVLALVEVEQLQVEREVDLAPAALRVRRLERDEHAAQDRVVLAGVDLDLDVLERLLDLLL